MSCGKFEAFNAKRMLKQIGDDPERLFLGAADPFGGKVWGKILGKDYEPIVDQMGGATKGSFEAAEKAGIDTKQARKAHDVAHAVAAFYGGQGLMNAGGLGGGAGASGGGASTGATGGAFNFSPVNGSGEIFGAGSFGGMGGGAASGGGSSGFDFGKLMQGGMPGMGGRQQQQPVQPMMINYQPGDLSSMMETPEERAQRMATYNIWGM
jgi:hypothetical protein